MDPKMQALQQRCERLLDLLAKGRIDEAIALDEQELRHVEPSTAVHAVLGRDFLHQIDEAAGWLSECYDQAAKQMTVTALYAEMVGHDINFDEWSGCVCAYEMPFDEIMAELECNLGEYEYMHERQLILTGMDDLQKAMGEYCEAEEDDDDDSSIPEHLNDAKSFAFGLIMLRMQALLARAHGRAAERGHAVGSVPVLSSVHDMQGYEYISRPKA